MERFRHVTLFSIPFLPINLSHAEAPCVIELL